MVPTHPVGGGDGSTRGVGWHHGCREGAQGEHSGAPAGCWACGTVMARVVWGWGEAQWPGRPVGSRWADDVPTVCTRASPGVCPGVGAGSTRKVGWPLQENERGKGGEGSTRGVSLRQRAAGGWREAAGWTRRVGVADLSDDALPASSPLCHGTTTDPYEARLTRYPPKCTASTKRLLRLPDCKGGGGDDLLVALVPCIRSWYLSSVNHNVFCCKDFLIICSTLPIYSS